MLKNILKTTPTGLLTEFLEEKAREYVEPSRKGTPKGDSIGFSKVKHCASLCCITSMSLKEIAENLNISYGLLRKWRTEEEFKKTINNHRTDFGDFFMEKFKKELSEYLELLKNPKKQNMPPALLRIERYVVPDFNYSFLADHEIYGAETITLVTSLLKTGAEDMRMNVDSNNPDLMDLMAWMACGRFAFGVEMVFLGER